jgi:hypothetical protein
MGKKTKRPQKAAKKMLLKEIEVKLADTVKDYHKKISDKKFGKHIHRAGKILARSLTKEQITVVHKEKTKQPTKVKKAPSKEVAVEA